MTDSIEGATAVEIAGSVRSLIERGQLSRRGAASCAHPRRPTRCQSQHRHRGVPSTGEGRPGDRRRPGQRSGGRLPEEVAREGYSDTALRDVGNGDPDPALIPDLAGALRAVVGRPVLYGAPVVDPDLETWALEAMANDLAPSQIRVSVTSGAADALERLLAGLLSRGDAVAIEDPGFLTGIHTIRVGGFTAIGVPVDDQGMTPDGLRRALEQGARAVICTPRAQNPTGASVSEERAAQLREVLARHPYALVVEDDHFSLLSARPFRSIVPMTHRRFALVRSVSKFLGPDMSLALVASDPHTAERLGMRLRPGTAWVSHLLQRLSLSLLTDDAARTQIAAAGERYASRNAAFCRSLAKNGVDCAPGDGLNVWVPVTAPARSVSDRLKRRGWLVRAGDEFRVISKGDDTASRRIRVTAHALTDADQHALAADIAAAGG